MPPCRPVPLPRAAPRRRNSGTLGVSATVASAPDPVAARVDAPRTLRRALNLRTTNTTEIHVFEIPAGSLSRKSSHTTAKGDHVDFGQDTSTCDSP
ncbi:hypothetical protein Shyhy02_25600 [Streptomyces hygroscopicus subsp. hygroscopicus]|nr:hypothetical protein Shyhy02_25600 [Streptomyces hygroscopicus subsp. hygroscopicus]